MIKRGMVEVGFVRPAHQGIIIAENDLGALLDKMAAYRPHTPIFRMRPAWKCSPISCCALFT